MGQFFCTCLTKLLVSRSRFFKVRLPLHLHCLLRWGFFNSMLCRRCWKPWLMWVLEWLKVWSILDHTMPRVRSGLQSWGGLEDQRLMVRFVGFDRPFHLAFTVGLLCKVRLKLVFLLKALTRVSVSNVCPPKGCLLPFSSLSSIDFLLFSLLYKLTSLGDLRMNLLLWVWESTNEMLVHGTILFLSLSTLQGLMTFHHKYLVSSVPKD